MAITVGDKTYRNLPEQVEENANNIEQLKFLISQLGTAMTYKGSVATYADLPTENNKIGDVWNVIDTGSNYAWTGEEWDEFGSAIDTSNLVDLDSSQTITGAKTFESEIYLKNSSYTWEISVNPYGTLTHKYNSTDIFYIYQNQYASTISLRPVGPNAHDLGTSSLAWKDLYLSGNAYVGGLYPSGNTNNGFTYSSNDFAWNLNAHLRPLGDNQRDLGSSGARWKNLYLSGVINGSSGIALRPSNVNYDLFSVKTNEVLTWVGIRPASDGSQNLGTSTSRWGTVYSNNISDGTNSVTVADLAWKEYDIVNNTVSVSASVIVSGTFFENSISITGAGFPAGTKEVLVELSNGSIYSANSIYSATSFYINSTVNMQSMTPTITKIYYR